MKNLTLGKKITLGFSALLVIATVLGVIAIVNMKQAGKLATDLTTKYVPESDLAAELEISLGKVMLAVRSYGLTCEESYLEKISAGQKLVAENQADLEKLAAEHPDLVKLRDLLKELQSTTKTFTSLVDDTITNGKQIIANRKVLDEAAATFTANIEKLINGQNEKLDKEILAGAEAAKLQERKHKADLADLIQTEGDVARLANFKAQALRNPSFIETGLKNFTSMDQHIASLLASLKAAEDIAELKVVETSAHAYRDAMKQIQTDLSEMAELGRRRIEAAEKLQAQVDEIQDVGVARINEAAVASRGKMSRASIIMIIGLIIALGVGVFLSTGIVRSINKVLNRITESLADGSAQIASASSQVSFASQSTAEGASEQAASLEETSASLEEIASMTKRNAENAGNCKSLSSQACASVNTGLKSLTELSRTLDAIKAAVAEMQTAVTETQSSSQEISKIIKTIDEIAFQTNLLALNAAVEAARAGEAGAGFAVVADEVRSLAQRSAQAARDTANKIESAVKRSELGGIANSKVVKSLTEVEGTAQSIQQVFSGIVTQIQSLDQIVAEIAAASKEQSQGITEVNMAVSQMDKVTQSNAANAEENAASSEELNAQAASLQDMVGQLELITVGYSRPLEAAPTRPSKVKNTRQHPLASAKPKVLVANRDNAHEAFGVSLSSQANQSVKSPSAEKRGEFQNF